ncbi:MAG TPA: hypothetical protein VF665_06765 [Longimicrobium sp.]
MPIAVLLASALRTDSSLQGQESDTPYVQDEMVPCWLACVTPYGGETRNINGRIYRLANCYLIAPGLCECIWVWP